MTFSRQEIVRTLRRAGLEDAAAAALSTLPEQMDDKTIERFWTAYGLTQESPAGQGHRRPLGRARGQGACPGRTYRRRTYLPGDGTLGLAAAGRRYGASACAASHRACLGVKSVSARHWKACTPTSSNTARSRRRSTGTRQRTDKGLPMPPRSCPRRQPPRLGPARTRHQCHVPPRDRQARRGRPPARRRAP